MRVLVLLLAHRDDDHLLGRDPDREFPRHVLDVHPDEALEAPENRAVEHRWSMSGAVLADELETEAIGQHVVELDRSELPAAPDRVLHVELDLRTVDGALPGNGLEGQPGVAQRFVEGLLGEIPLGIRAHALVRTQGELQ